MINNTVGDFYYTKLKAKLNTQEFYIKQNFALYRIDHFIQGYTCL